MMITDVTRVQHCWPRSTAWPGNGSAQATIVAADAEELARLLILDSIPPADVSQDRLVGAGFTQAAIVFGQETLDSTGSVWHITATNGSQVITAGGLAERKSGGLPQKPPSRPRALPQAESMPWGLARLQAQ